MAIVLLNILIYNLLLMGALLFLVKKNPRYIMQDYPEEIIKGIESKTEKEKRESMLWGLPFIILNNLILQTSEITGRTYEYLADKQNLKENVHEYGKIQSNCGHIQHK